MPTCPDAGSTSVAFGSQAAIGDGVADKVGVRRRLVAVTGTRSVGKIDLPENAALPSIEVEPDTFTGRVEGEVWEQEPATELPMAQRYFLF